MILSLTGFMGSGKSCTGRALAERLGWNFVDLDEYVSAKAGRSIPEIFAEGGEGAFRALEVRAVEEIIGAKRERDLVLALGGGTLETPRAADAVLRGTLCIYLEAAPEFLRRWIEGTEGTRPMLGRGDWEGLLERRRPRYESAHRKVDASAEPEKILEEICAIISEFA